LLVVLTRQLWTFGGQFDLDVTDAAINAYVKTTLNNAKAWLGSALSVRFWGLGSGFRVQGSGFRVQGSGFRVQGSGFRETTRSNINA